jgi:hypothetical protein
MKLVRRRPAQGRPEGIYTLINALHFSPYLAKTFPSRNPPETEHHHDNRPSSATYRLSKLHRN